MLTPGIVKSLLQPAKVIEWECGCTVSLLFTIWFILEYGIYITITWINEKICKLTEMYVFLCFSAQWNSHLGISMSHISSTNQSKQQFAPWHVLHRKLDFIIIELITLEFFSGFFLPSSLWIQNKHIWKYAENTLVKIAFGTHCG